MPTSYGALCADFYINLKLALKMDLPSDRETILHLFDRVRRSVPTMDQFRRYEGEFALESTREEGAYQWVALRRKSVRTGIVNPDSMEQAYRFHRLILEQAPHHLTISPLDVDYLELLFGFDLECRGNHDEIVADALFADSPMGELLGKFGNRVIDTQPLVVVSLDDQNQSQACFEVKTRRKTRRGHSGRYADDPISLLLTLRRFGPVEQVASLPEMFKQLGQQAEALATDRLVPHLLTPIARQITSSNA